MEYVEALRSVFGKIEIGLYLGNKARYFDVQRSPVQSIL